jgi:hypothetical protein
VRAAILVALASCAIPDDHYAAFQCAPPPSPAPAEVTVTGTIVNAFQSLAPVEGVAVTVMPSGATKMTDANGQFTATVSTTGSPSFALSETGFLPTVYVPATSLTGDLAFKAELFLEADLAELAGSAVGSDTEQMIVSVVDCMDDAVGGATITADSGAVVYFQGVNPTGSATMTDELSGAAIVIGITGSNTTVGASRSDVTFGPNMVGTMPGVMIETEVAPSVLP